MVEDDTKMRAFLISIPKSGTNLVDQMISTCCGGGHVIIDYHKSNDHPLQEIISVINSPPVPFVRSHLIYTPEYESSIEKYGHTFFLFRDLRDVLVSSMFWDSRVRANQKPHEVNLSDDEIDEKLIFQMHKWSGVFPRFLGWLDVARVHKFNYEELISDPDGQSKRLGGIIGCGWQSMVKVFGSRVSNTFRRGKIGDWRLYFKPHHIEMFQDEFGEVQAKLGYKI